ncbi:MAG: tetratricopeptide repeat protein [Actinomycetota bacterium]|nr:tetratricopeptide repeat protein [Actinomycetota bacterium]
MLVAPDGRGMTASTGAAALPARRCLIVLTVAASRHPVAATALFALLRRRPALVAHATAPTVQMVVDQAPDEVAAAVYSALPGYSTDLLWAATALARRLYDTLPATAGAAQQAHRLDNLSLRLSALGRRDDALAASTQAVGIYRRLVATDPAAFEPDLARTLTNFGIRLSALGRWEDAVMATTEAVEVNRRLAATNRTAFEPDLAGSLNNLSVMLSDLGLQRDALTASTQAVEIRRRLVAGNRTAFEPEFAMALNNLSVVLSNLGQRQDALAASTQSVEIYRRLAATTATTFEPDLARALTNLGADLADLGRLPDALTTTRQAVEIRRQLDAANPAAFEPDLARALWVFARVRSTGQVELPQALTAGQQSVAHFERLFQQWPRVFAGDLRGARATVADVLKRS